MNKKKIILLVEDEVDLAQLIELRLRANGYEVISAYDGVEALRKLDKAHPDLIILDINLPNMGGIEFYNKIETPHGRSRYPVLVVTGRGDLEKTFKDIKVDGFLIKPFEANALLSEIERITSARSERVIFLIDYKANPHVEGIMAYLKFERYEVDHLENFTVLQEKAKEQKPDYILMEYMQKEMSGEAFIKKIREDPMLRVIPIIVYSYSGFKEYEKRSIEAGADKYIGKPENYTVFVTAIKELEMRDPC